jgi:hypothetical protein
MHNNNISAYFKLKAGVFGLLYLAFITSHSKQTDIKKLRQYILSEQTICFLFNYTLEPPISFLGKIM